MNVFNGLPLVSWLLVYCKTGPKQLDTCGMSRFSTERTEFASCVHLKRSSLLRFVQGNFQLVVTYNHNKPFDLAQFGLKYTIY